MLLLWNVQRLLLGQFGPLLEIFCQVHKMEAARIIPPEIVCQTSADFGLLSEVVCIHDAPPAFEPLGDPNSPVCRQDEVKLFLGYGVHPAADSTSARKCESVFAVVVDNGELHVAIERSGIY
jgi:hypothetical protein